MKNKASLTITAGKKYNPIKGEWVVRVVALYRPEDGAANRTFESVIGTTEELFADQFAERTLEGMFNAIDKPLFGGYREITKRED